MPREETATQRMPKWTRTASLTLLSAVLAALVFLLGSLGGPITFTVHASASEITTEIDGANRRVTPDRDAVAGGVTIRYYSGATPNVYPARISRAILRAKDASKGINLLDAFRCRNLDGEITECTASGEWRDFDLTVECRNCYHIEIASRVTAGHAVKFWARTWLHRDWGLIVESGGQRADLASPVLLDLGIPGMCLQVCAIAGFSAALALLLLLLAVTVSSIGGSGLPPWARKIGGFVTRPWVLGILAAGTFAWLLRLTLGYYEGVPHFDDSIAYWFVGKALVRGLVAIRLPVFPEHFPLPEPMFQLIHDRWITVYPVGWPAMLAVGHFIRAPWLIPAACGSATLVAVYCFARSVSEGATALLAAVLLALSPWFQMTAANFMSHGAAAAAALMATWCYFEAERSYRLRPCVLAGVCAGSFFLIRPYDALLLAIPLAVFAGMKCYREPRWWKSPVAMAAGSVPLLVVHFAWIWARTGTFANPYGGAAALGFHDSYPASTALLNFVGELGLFAKCVLPLPAWAAFTPAIAALLFRPTKIDVKLFVLAGIFPFGYFFCVRGTAFLAHGPRYWYPCLPFFVILSARGAIKLLRGMEPNRYAYAALGMLLAVGLFSSELAWLGPEQAYDERFSYTPVRVGQLRGYMEVKGDIFNRISAIESLALVFYRTNSERFRSLAVAANEPEIDKGRLIVAADLGEEKNRRLIERYAGRKLYHADYERNELRSYCEKYSCPKETRP